MKKLLPLAYHAQELVIEDNDLHINLALHNSAELLQGHLEASISYNGDHRSFRRTYFCTDSSRKCKSHCPESPGCNIASCVIEFCITAGYHLVLAYISNNNRLTTGELIQHVYHLTHGHLIFYRVQLCMNTCLFFLQLMVPETLEPAGINFLLNQCSEHRKSFFAITPNRYCSLHILIYFCRINIEMNDFGLLGIFVQSSSNTVVEPHSNSYQYIAFICQYIGTIIAVHA